MATHSRLVRSLWALVVLAAACAGAAAPASAAGLQNAGFEAGLDHWTPTKVQGSPGGYYGDPHPIQSPAQPVDCRVPDGVCVVEGADRFTAPAGGYGGGSIEHAVAPPEGARMVRLGGPFASSGTSQPVEQYRLEQEFTVDPAQPRLALSFNAFTWDYTGFDVLLFRVTLADDDGDVLAERTLGSFGQGVSLKTTGWRPMGIDLAGYEGRTVRLRIEAGGTRDTAYGFWAYVDAGTDLPPSPVGQPTHGAVPNTPAGQPVVVNDQVDEATGLTWFSVPASQAALFPGGCVPLPISVPIAAGGGTVSDVQLLLDRTDGTRMTYPLAGGGAGVWSGTIDCLRSGELFVEYTLAEGGDAQRYLVPLGGLVLIDPQGVVYDKTAFDAAIARGATPAQARAQSAIQGATVRLQRKVGGTFVNVLSGDPGIAPKINPQITQADGRYQWDVAAGEYRVVVTKPGFVTATSAPVTIPPPVLDLHIPMTRPAVAPTVPGGGSATTGGERATTTGGEPAPVTPAGRPADRAAAIVPPQRLSAPSRSRRPAPCAGRTGAAAQRCQADRRLATALAACAKLTGKRRAACRRTARARAACERLAKPKQRSRCLAKLRPARRRAARG